MPRTPSVTAHEKALDAAIRLIEERGIEGASMDAIAQLSGVSKATLYKHWKDKDALCIEVLNKLRDAPPEFRSGNIRRDLTDLLTHIARARKQVRFMKILPRMVSYAASHPKFGKAVRDSTLAPTGRQLMRILNEGIASGDLLPETDPELATSMLFGPILHRKIIGGKVPARFPEHVVDAFWQRWGADAGKAAASAAGSALSYQAGGAASWSGPYRPWPSPADSRARSDAGAIPARPRRGVQKNV